jgi:type I restriction enzyme S subunit
MLDEKRITGTHLAPYLRNVDVQWSHVNTVDLPEMDFSDEDRERYALRKGDFLVCEGGEVGRTSIWDGALAECYFQKAIHRLRPTTHDDDPRFFRYFMWMAVQSGIFAQTTASTIQHLTAEKLRIVRYPAPPIAQQRAIADYLDRETARLDALVETKERVLGLLAEKRRALITAAVTRGLDPRAPLRDSGIPWFGEIPTGWKARRLKFQLHRIEQGWSPQCDNTTADFDEWGVLKAGCVNAWAFDPNENKRLPTDVEPLTQYEVRSGDVLMSRANTTALLGSTALVREIRPRLLLCDKLYRLNVKESILCKEYLVNFLRYPVGRYEFERDATGTSNSMQNIGQDSVCNLWIPIPPLDEQRAIVSHIAAETTKLDAMRAATEQTIALLKERRAALIAAAVTGRIDVKVAAA